MYSVLVADDNSNIQKMVSLALKDEGIDVVAVGNGEAAVRKLAEYRPDLILADIFMPVRNGYEVCEYVKKDQRFADIPVILLIGAFDPLDEDEVRRVRADGVLKKPFVPPDPLIGLVKSTLENRFPRLATQSAAPPPAAGSTPAEAATPEPEPEPDEFDVPQRVEFPEGEKPLAFGAFLEAGGESSEDEPESQVPPFEASSVAGANLDEAAPASSYDVVPDAELVPEEWNRVEGDSPQEPGVDVRPPENMIFAPSARVWEDRPRSAQQPEAPRAKEHSEASTEGRAAAPEIEVPPPQPEVQAAAPAVEQRAADQVPSVATPPPVEPEPAPAVPEPQARVAPPPAALPAEPPREEPTPYFPEQEEADAFSVPQPVDPTLVDSVVDQLVERLRPQIEQVTREMLRPVAEAMLQREQEKSGERVRG